MQICDERELEDHEKTLKIFLDERRSVSYEKLISFKKMNDKIGDQHFIFFPPNSHNKYDENTRHMVDMCCLNAHSEPMFDHKVLNYDKDKGRVKFLLKTHQLLLGDLFSLHQNNIFTDGMMNFLGQMMF